MCANLGPRGFDTFFRNIILLLIIFNPEKHSATGLFDIFFGISSVFNLTFLSKNTQPPGFSIYFSVLTSVFNLTLSLKNTQPPGYALHAPFFLLCDHLLRPRRGQMLVEKKRRLILRPQRGRTCVWSNSHKYDVNLPL
jgi:hypothetical protein